MARNKPITHPVFKELDRIAQPLDYPTKPDEGAFTKCRARLAPGLRRRCEQKIAKENQLRAKKLVESFRILDICSSTESFYQEVCEFLSIIHCTDHAKISLSIFEIWKANRSSILSPIALTSTVSDNAHLVSSYNTQLSRVGQIETNTKTAPQQSLAAIGLIQHISKTSGIGASVNVQNNVEPPTVEISTRLESLSLSTTHKNSLCNAEDESPRTATVSSTASRHGGEHVIGLGYIIPTLPKRNGSVRDQSAIFTEWHKELGKLDQKSGVLYILKHEKTKGIFKVGWSRNSAVARLQQSRNCYRKDTTIIYETESGKFFAAKKAESLVQIVLQRYNYQLEDCDQCSKGHTEWYKISENMVLQTVKTIEQFVQEQAYEERGGVWKLSEDAFRVIGQMCHFDLSKLQKHLTTNNGDSDNSAMNLADTKSAMSIAETELVAVDTKYTHMDIAEDSHREIERYDAVPDSHDGSGESMTIKSDISITEIEFESLASESHMEDLEEDSQPVIETSEIPPSSSSRAQFGVQGGKKIRRIRNSFPFGKSREGTPEVTEGCDKQNSSDSGAMIVESRGLQERMTEAIWNAVPEAVKELAVDVDGDAPQTAAALALATWRATRGLTQNIKRGYQDPI